MPYLKRLHSLADMRDLIFYNRARYKHMDAFTHNVLRGPSELTPAERELIASYVSINNSCIYCTGVHVEVAMAFGIETTKIEALKNHDYEAYEPKFIPILQLVKKLTQTPSKVVQSDIDSIISVGWKEQTVEDVIAITALFNYFNRMMDGLGIRGSQFLFEEAGVILSKRGYKFPSIVVWFLKKTGWKREK
ncbi:MAG TPA: peroxidase-related enzyme [Saprospiraceae bacterium]|nr:peroxidase-related enzyme [Saprospiraceae bacterium]